MFDARLPQIPSSLATLDITHAVVLADGVPTPPALLCQLMDKETPALVYGSPSSVRSMVDALKVNRGHLSSRDIAVYIREKLPFSSGNFLYVTRAATIMGREDTLRKQVSPSPSVCPDCI